MVSPSQEGVHSQRARTLLNLGLAALRRGARSLARNRLARVVELEPATAEAWIALARVSVSPADAVSHLRQALELSPDSAVARAGLLWHSSLMVESESGASVVPEALPEPPVVREAEEVIGSEAQAVEVEATESVVAAPELLADETQSVQTTVVPPQADERMRFEVGSTPETPVVLVETSEVMAPETGLDTAAGLPPIAAEVAMSTAVAAIEMVPEAPTAPLDEHVDSVPTDVDAELELVPSVAAPQVSEQELATAEWQRWLTGRQGSPSAVQPTMTSGPAIVNEVSERLAHALQRVLGARAGLSLRTTPDNLTPVNTTPNIPAMGNPASDNPPPVLATPERAESATTSEPAPAAATTEAEEPAIAIENAFDDVSSETPPGEPVDDRPSVLVVDDSPTIRRVVADALRPRGYRVYEAADGIQGIREIATIRPDLILMDITMPRLDGYRLCRLVKGHANTRSIPVVMLSGKDGTFDRLRGRLAGCSDYISKPFSNADLLDKVARHLAAKKPVAVR